MVFTGAQYIKINVLIWFRRQNFPHILAKNRPGQCRDGFSSSRVNCHRTLHSGFHIPGESPDPLLLSGLVDFFHTTEQFVRNVFIHH